MIATEAEIEKLQASEKSIMDKSSDIHRSHDEDDQHSEFSIPQTPSRLYRFDILNLIQLRITATNYRIIYGGLIGCYVV